MENTITASATAPGNGDEGRLAHCEHFSLLAAFTEDGGPLDGGYCIDRAEFMALRQRLAELRGKMPALEPGERGTLEAKVADLRAELEKLPADRREQLERDLAGGCGPNEHAALADMARMMARQFLPGEVAFTGAA